MFSSDTKELIALIIFKFNFSKNSVREVKSSQSMQHRRDFLKKHGLNQRSLKLCLVPRERGHEKHTVSQGNNSRSKTIKATLAHLPKPRQFPRGILCDMRQCLL